MDSTRTQNGVPMESKITVVNSEADDTSSFSSENAKHATVTFKAKLQQTTQRFESQLNEQEVLSNMTALCGLIGDTADKQFDTTIKEEIDFYEKLLDAPIELNIHGLAFGFIEKYVTDIDNVDPSKIELLIACFSVVAHIASGNAEQTKCVKKTDIVCYAETFALQKNYSALSVVCFKLLVCFMSEDDDYARNIGIKAEYVVRACELNVGEDLDVNGKAWLIFFCDLAFQSSDIGWFNEGIINSCLATACSHLYTDSFFLLKQSIRLVKTAFDVQVFEQEFLIEGARDNNPVYTVLEHLLRRMTFLLSHPENCITEDALYVLGNIILSDDVHFGGYERTLPYMALSSGLMNHIPNLLCSDNERVLERVLWLLSKLVNGEQAPVLKLESFYTFLPYVCFHVRSHHIHVVWEALCVLYDILESLYIGKLERKLRYYTMHQSHETDEEHPDIEYVENNPEVLYSLLSALRNLHKLGKDAYGDIATIATILENGLHCFKRIIRMGCDEDGTKLHDKIANMLNEPCVFETFVFLGTVDPDKYAVEDFTHKVQQMKAMLKQVFEANGVNVANDMGIFADLPPPTDSQ